VARPCEIKGSAPATHTPLLPRALIFLFPLALLVAQLQQTLIDRLQTFGLDLLDRNHVGVSQRFVLYP